MGRSRLSFNLCGAMLVASALLACGGSQPAASAPGEPAAEAPAGSPEVWSDTMPVNSKAEFMKKKVMPAMSKTFQEHDPKKYADAKCALCHGPQFKPHPADFLPQLHFADGKLKEAETEPDMVKFMHDQVAPQMAEIFGKKPYDPATNEGFGCKGCHVVKM